MIFLPSKHLLKAKQAILSALIKAELARRNNKVIIIFLAIIVGILHFLVHYL